MDFKIGDFVKVHFQLLRSTYYGTIKYVPSRWDLYTWDLYTVEVGAVHSISPKEEEMTLIFRPSTIREFLE